MYRDTLTGPIGANRSRSISHKARDPKSTGRRQLPIVSPIIPGVTAIPFLRLKKTSTHLHLCTGCAY